MAVLLLLVLATAVVEPAYGIPPLRPLPIKDGCFVASTEVEVFRVEGEAVILSFPMFGRVLQVRNIAPSSASYTISKGDGSGPPAGGATERVLQSNKQLWFLPAKASDSGEYTCTYRNETYCVTGSIRLHVYDPLAADMAKLSFPITAMVGERLSFRCPSIGDFNSTHRLVQWSKDSVPDRLEPEAGGSFLWNNGKLLIPAVEEAHAGLYTCQLNVLINNQRFKVSRAILLRVEVPETTPPPTMPGLTTTGQTSTTTSTTSTTTTTSTSTTTSTTTTSTTTLTLQRPVIVSPRNGSSYQIPHGSAEEISCRVITDCRAVDSTEVTWLVNGQSVEASYLDRRALQGGRRVTRVSEGCEIELRLIVLEISEADVSTELRCVARDRAGSQDVVTHLELEDPSFTWLVVAMAAGSCFLAVVSTFLCVLFKSRRKKKMDYFLARQNSTF